MPEFKHEQNEYVFANTSPDPGAVDRRRIMSQSELQHLMDAGVMFKRTVVLN